MVELDGRLSVPTVWQQSETPAEAVADFHARLDRTLARMVADAVAAGGAVAGEAVPTRSADQAEAA